MSALSEIVVSSDKATAKSDWGRRFDALWRSWDARASLILICGMLVLAVIPNRVWPDSTFVSNLMLRFTHPGLHGGFGQLLGTDTLGRDMVFRILAATKLTLFISGVATILATVTGTIAGLAAGYFRGWVDMLVSRLIDLMLAFPIILLILALVAALGQSLSSLIIVLGLSGWAGYARVIRSSALTLGGADFVEASRCAGANSWRILSRHLLPNVASPVLVLSTLNIASFILLESAVSFLGLGVQPPNITWGSLIGDGQNFMYQAWWTTLFPGVAIMVAVLAFNLIGDAVRDAFDPYARSRRN